jgi:hypothetical protein
MEIPPLKNWDFMSILYSLIASAIFLIILKWAGIYKKIILNIENNKAHKKYKKQLIEECNNLIVVGKRKGFSLHEVYVDLDLTPSDLMGGNKDEIETQKSYILLGGPGAGKSTTAKNKIINHFKEGYFNTIPFFIRLKDYNGTKPLFNYLIDKLDLYGFSNSTETVKKNLISPHSLCILDGLDEVRPHLRKAVCDQINDFYSNYFSDFGRLIITCRKEAYRDIPLNINLILEVRPLSDEQIKRFASKWPLEYPLGKTKETFFNELQTSPRIMELTRSPLLLVGGLMHYTEANLGIPEERFEYLQTMARWLVIDWAMAQGHPSEQYKNVYDRILTCLAYHMQNSNLSEIPFPEACSFISTILPTYGYRSEEAENILNSITIKTGILIKDGSSLFFAQFGLQEYYTSKELSNQLDVKKIAKLQPTSWWREVVLLYTAQLKDPTELLSNLFTNDPVLAVAAVAECPTPSLEMQNKAITVCLENIDKKNNAIKGSLIPFLRKIRDNIETKFYFELEKRLIGDEETSSIVGISLATAGTPIANGILAKHPEVWNICLGEAGYLSSSFENLLVEWIQNGEDNNSIKAANLLSKRISSDRLIQLLNILPSLNKKKKEHLSILLLKEVAYNSQHSFEYGSDGLSIISQLLPNISNPKQIIKELTSQKKKPYRGYPASRSSIIPAIIIAFFIKTKNEKCDSDDIYSTFSNGILWHDKKKSLFLWILSATIFLLPFVNSELIRLLLFLGFSFIYFLVYSTQQRHYPYLPMRYYLSYRNRQIGYLVFYLLGGSCVLYILDFYKLLTVSNINILSIVSTSIVLSLLGFIQWGFNDDLINGDNRRINKHAPIGLSFPLNFNLFFLVILLFSGISLYFNFSIISLSTIITIIYLFWVCSTSFHLYKHWKRIKNAESLANKELNNDLDSFRRW